MSMQVESEKLDCGEEDSGGSWACQGMEMVAFLIKPERCWKQKEFLCCWYGQNNSLLHVCKADNLMHTCVMETHPLHHSPFHLHIS